MSETTICVECKHHVRRDAHVMQRFDHICTASPRGLVSPVTGISDDGYVLCSERNFGACPIWEAKK